MLSVHQWQSRLNRLHACQLTFAAHKHYMSCLHVAPATSRKCPSFCMLWVYHIHLQTGPPVRVCQETQLLKCTGTALTGRHAVPGDEEGCGHHAASLLLLQHKPVPGLSRRP